MTNREWLNSLDDLEFTDYIISVFLTGKYLGKNITNKSVIKEYNLTSIDYKIWLEQENNNEL